MEITLNPQRRDATIALSKLVDVLSINGTHYASSGISGVSQ